MHQVETDPYQAPLPASLPTIRWSARAALASGTAYVAFRLLFTLDGTALATALLLLIAEALGLVVFALRATAAWHEPEQPVDVPDAPLPSTTVVVDAAGSTAEAVRTSLVSCGRLRGAERIVVADPCDAAAIRAVAERFGAAVVVQAATRVAAETSAMWVLVVRAGDLPLPDALELLATPCSAPDVGIVQLGVEEANPSSFEHDPTGRWSLAPFEHQVLRPSLAAQGSIPWYGDVPAMVRPASIRDAQDTSGSTIDLGIHANALGYRVTLVPRTLARLRGPQSLAESLRDRFARTSALRRRAVGRMEDVPRDLRRPFRLALAEPLAAIQRCLLVAVGVLAMGYGQLPIAGSTIAVALFGLPAYALRWQAQTLLGRGRLGRFSVLRSELRSVGVDLTFGYGGNLGGLRGRLVVLGMMTTLIALAVAVGAVAVWRDWSGRMPIGATAVTLALAAGFLIVAAEVLLDALARRQRRRNHRVRLGRVSCRLEGRRGELRDLSMGGCGLAIEAGAEPLPSRDETVTVSFRIPDADGAWRDVVTTGRVAHIRATGPGEHRVGLAFVNPTEHALDPVVEFLTIDRRLVALGRRAPAMVDGWSGEPIFGG